MEDFFELNSPFQLIGKVIEKAKGDQSIVRIPSAFDWILDSSCCYFDHICIDLYESLSP